MAEKNTILSDESEVVRDIQLTIRNELIKRRKPLKAVGFDSGLGYSTLLTYFPNPESNEKPNALPLAAFRLLIEAMSPDLLSLLLPEGWQIVRVPEALNHDEVAEALCDYLHTKERAHHPASEDGREIGPREDNVLRGKFAKVRAA